MNDITYAVSVDVNNPVIPYNVYVASVLDSNVRYLEITLYENGNVIALSNEATATAALVTDNVLVDGSVECTISNNIITVPLEDLQRHGNLDVQVTVTEGTRVLTIPFPIQVKVMPNIAGEAQVNENSMGSYAEVVQEIAEARGTYDSLDAAIQDQSVYHYETTDRVETITPSVEFVTPEPAYDSGSTPYSYINSNGRITAYAGTSKLGSACSEKFAVTYGDTLRVISTLVSSTQDSPIYLIYFYSGDTPLSGAVTSDSFGEVVAKVDVPENATHAAINVFFRKSTPISDRNFSVTRHYTTNLKMDEKLRRLEQAMQTTELTGKRLLIAGDSLMYGDGNNGSSVGEYLRDKYGMTLTKNAVTGTTLAVRDGRTDSIYERMTTLSGDYDYIIFDGGINDNSAKSNNDPTPKAPTGKVTGSFDPEAQDDSIDVSTTVGALEAICRFLVLNYPDAKKLFVISHELTLPTGLLRNSTYLSRMAECIKALEKWGIPYVDMTKTQLKIVGGNSQTKYFHSGDRTHPNAAGYAIYCKEVEKALLYRI